MECHVRTLETMIHQRDDGEDCICAECRAIRYAASALRSSGEAVAELRGLHYVRDYIATSGQDYGIGSYRRNGSGFERNFSNRDDLLCCIDRQIEKLSATPASAWRPIAEAPRDSRVVLLCDEHGNRWTDVSPGDAWEYNGCGYPPVVWQDLPPPPTSTNARRVCNRNCDCVGPCKAGLED